MKKKYIDVEKLHRDFIFKCSRNCSECDYNTFLSDIERCGLIEEQPTVSEQEIRDKVIGEFIHRIDKECGYHNGENKNLSREMLLRIAEQMKESEETTIL